MDDPEADLAEVEFEALDHRRGEVRGEEQAHQGAAGEDGEGKGRAWGRHQTMRLRI